MARLDLAQQDMASIMSGAKTSHLYVVHSDDTLSHATVMACFACVPTDMLMSELDRVCMSHRLEEGITSCWQVGNPIRGGSASDRRQLSSGGRCKQNGTAREHQTSVHQQGQCILKNHSQ